MYNWWIFRLVRLYCCVLVIITVMIYLAIIANILGPTSLYPFHGITEFIEGEPVGIPFDINILTKLFLEDMSPDKYNIDFHLWRRERKSGVVLTTPECIKYMQNEFNKQWTNVLQAAQKNGTMHLFNKESYHQAQRRDVARKLSVYVNNVSMYDWDYAMSTDFFHGFDTHIIYVVIWIMLFSHCILENQIEDTITVFDSMDLPWLTKAVTKYIEQTNAARNLNTEWDFTSNGHNLKLICNNLYYALSQLGWTAHEKLESQLRESGVTIDDIINSDIRNVDIDISLLIPMLKIASQYSAHKNLRRAFSLFWSSTTDKSSGDGLPPSVKTLKYHLRKGFYTILNITPETVSVNTIFFGLIKV